jgi:hypothetical protein
MTALRPRNTISDEKLMAYSDGMLSPADEQRVESALENDPELVERLEVFRLSAGVALSQPFAEILKMPIPPRLVRTVVSTNIAPVGARARAQRAGIAKRLAVRLGDLTGRGGGARPSGGRTRYVPAWSLAAAGALAVALALGWAVDASRRGAADDVPLGVWGVPASPGLADALDSRARGETARLAEAGSLAVTPVASFRSKDKEWCRSYERWSTEAPAPTFGLACRAEGEPWRVKIEVAARSTGAYAPQGEHAGSDPVTAIALHYMVGSVLGAEEEAQQVARRWGSKR